jgi:hypothetical protein
VSRKKYPNPAFASKLLLLLQNVPFCYYVGKNGSSIKQKKNDKLARDLAGGLEAKKKMLL